jgi:Holliday junction resolvasome RuvABC DNA-binding subunit
MKEQHRSIVKPKLSSISGGYIDADRKRSVRFLMGIPGFGEIKALSTLRTLGSLDTVLDAIKRRDYKSFRQVTGVGKALIDSSAEFLERKIQ